MGKVLIALSNDHLLDPEMMFSEGEFLPLFSFADSGRTDERRKEKYVPNSPP